MLEKMYNEIKPASLTLFGGFTILKSIGVLQWSWFWIASPLWIAFFGLFGIVYCSLKNRIRKES